MAPYPSYHSSSSGGVGGKGGRPSASARRSMPSLSSSSWERALVPAVFWTVVCSLFLIYVYCKYRKRRRNLNGDDACQIDDSNGQRNKRSASKRPVVSIVLNNLLIKRGSDPSLSAFDLIETSVDAFLQLCEITRLHTVAKVNDDAEEKRVIQILEDIGAFEKGLKRHRAMFSSTDMGRACMVRQLQPMTHIDSEGEIVDHLTRKVPNVAYVRLSEKPLDKTNEILSRKNDTPDFPSLQSCVDLLKAVSKVSDL